MEKYKLHLANIAAQRLAAIHKAEEQAKVVGLIKLAQLKSKITKKERNIPL